MSTVEITYSISGTHYYVSGFDHQRPTAWVPVEAGDVLPFAFWEIRSGDVAMVDESDPLVQRYAEAERWPARGSAEWHDEIARRLASSENLLGHAQQTVDFHTGEKAQLMALAEKYPVPAHV